MPSDVVKSIAKRAVKSVGEVEDLWDRAKKEVDDQYDDIDKDSDRYWKLVTSITKRMAGLEESVQKDDMEGGLEGKVRRTPSGEEIKEYKKKKKDGESYDEESSEDDSESDDEFVVESFKDFLDQEYDRL